jgi:GTPase
MIPVVTIVGRPNVGKSTLFNVLTKTRAALVFDFPGVTRDRQYGECKITDQPFIIIDTGGLGLNSDEMNTLVEDQSWRAVEEADVVLLVVDAKVGIQPADEAIAKQLRIRNKSVIVVVNKTDGLNPNVANAEFYSLGLGEPSAISAVHNHGINAVAEKIASFFPVTTQEDAVDHIDRGIKIAIVGKPNVGKSTLVNRMLGDERVVVFDSPGTTRDSIYLSLERMGEKYTIIDTAGVRKRGRIDELVEKFSVAKTLQAIQDCHVVLLLLDAREKITDQDLSLLGYVLESGRALVIAVNKWDGLKPEDRMLIKRDLEYRLKFVDFAKIHTISALHGTGVGDLFGSVKKAYGSATRKLSTNQLTELLAKAVTEHAPPLIRGRRIKLRYAHPGGQVPPLIIIHGNQTEKISDPYTRYLIGFFRKALKLEGTPIRITYKTSENPYAGRRNTLTPRQQYKRDRLKDYTKKKK